MAATIISPSLLRSRNWSPGSAPSPAGAMHRSPSPCGPAIWKAIELQPQEFKLLEYMLRNAGRVVTRSMLLENVWELNFDPRTNIVETHMSRLRTKMDRGYGVEMIRTIRGNGYSLRAD